MYLETDCNDSSKMGSLFLFNLYNRKQEYHDDFHMLLSEEDLAVIITVLDSLKHCHFNFTHSDLG